MATANIVHRNESHRKASDANAEFFVQIRVYPKAVVQIARRVIEIEQHVVREFLEAFGNKETNRPFVRWANPNEIESEADRRNANRSEEFRELRLGADQPGI